MSLKMKVLKGNYRKNSFLKEGAKIRTPIKISLEDHKEEETTKGDKDLREIQTAVREIHKLFIFTFQFLT